ncbi:DNA polymerase family X protein [Yasminevirus sp. GU-2018]|uniref:DNA-directed DNA polymerase n=1 Tax=Yasminevirus sp. GU-2018 TaxID=2420051 RepID=A0A5K0U7M4_9VIRU|nr:DNA polymerase family X protein [Yasminevirus sp. GU-2018]
MNDNIIKWFELLTRQLEFYVDVKTGKEKLIYSYKLNSISKALEVIRAIGFKIKAGKDLKDYKGIGKGTIERIDEILKTGKLEEVREADLSGKHLDYVDELMKIFGIGRVKAYELYTKHNIKSIDELKQAVKKGDVELPESILKGMKYVDKIKRSIPRSEMDEIYSKLIRAGIKLDPDMDVRMCGSYRREKDVSNDIDIIVSHPKIITKEQAEKSDLMLRFIKALEKEGFIEDSFTSEDVSTKYMGVCRLTPNSLLRRIDIRYMPQESYHTAVLYFTGSGEFNRRMRGVALSMGYTLNEYRLLDDKGRPFKVTSEKDVFDYLNMEYLQPKERV